MSKRPSILFVNQHYLPDVAATGQYLADLAEHLVRDGCEVHVLCASGRYEQGGLKAPRSEIRNGVHVHRLSTTGFGRVANHRRLADYVSFFVQVAPRLFFGRRYDQVVFLTTPPMLALAGLPARLLRRRRYGIWSMDLHPEAEVSIGMLRPEGRRARLLASLSRLSYRWAEFVVALGPFMAERLARAGVLEDRLHVVPIWHANGALRPVDHHDNPLVKKLGLEGKFIVMYSGNAGLVHRFDEVLDAIVRLKDHPEIYFLFAGNGPMRGRIEAFIEEHRLPNASYVDYFPRHQLQYSLSLGHVHLVTLLNEAAGVAVPSKLWGAMAAGRSVLMVGPEASEVGAIILRHGMGRVFDPATDPDVPGSLADAILDLYAHPDQSSEAGRRAREALMNHYRRAALCDSWIEVLRRHAGSVAGAEERAAVFGRGAVPVEP